MYYLEMRSRLLILALVPLVLLVIFFLSTIPFIQSGAVVEKVPVVDLTSCILPNASIAVWNNQEFYTKTEPDHIYLDGLKNKFIESGFSEDYFDRNVRLIYADVNEQKNYVSGREELQKNIDAWFMITTNSWLDMYDANGGSSIPICRDVSMSNCDVCKFYVTRVHGNVIIDYISNMTGPSVIYQILGKTWNSDGGVHDNRYAVPFGEINRVLSPWEAGLISKSCVPISLNRFDVFLSPKMDFEYVVQGENLQTVFNPYEHMQARINLVTGKMECNHQSSIIY
jgi:hypothetical protein